MLEKNIAFIGGGNMCRAIVNGLLMGGVVECDRIRIRNRTPEKLLDFKKIGIYPAQTAHDAVEFADILFLAVKPQNFDEVLDEIAGENFEGKTVVSIAAGITIKHINEKLGKNVAVVRAMPNTPMLIGLGAVGVCRNDNVSDEVYGEICSAFEKMAVVTKLSDEDMINKIIPVSGSSPAFVYLFIKIICDWAKENGFDEETAKKLVCATFEGSARMLLQSADTPDKLIRDVSSPGGTTLAALAEFEKAGITDIMRTAMDACLKRAYELSK